MAIDAMPAATSASLAWLEHAIGWEQDRRAGFHYPLRGPAETRDIERVDRVAAVDRLTEAFGHDAEILALIELGITILDGGSSGRHERLRHGYKNAA